MSVGNNAFSLQGATPQSILSSYQNNNPIGGSPQSRALDMSKFSLGGQPKQQFGPTAPPTPSTPLKKTTTTNVDGSSQVHEYHAPAAPGSPEAAATQQKADVQKYFPGLINNSSTTSTSTPPPVAPVTPPNPYKQSVESLNGQASTTNPAVSTAQSTLQGISQNQGTSATSGTPAAQSNTAVTGLLNSQAAPSPEVQAQIDRVRQANFIGNDIRNNSSVASDVAVGRGQTFTGVLNAENDALKNALTEQGQQITAGNDAAGAAGNIQGQQINSATNAGNLGINQQSNQITAATNAASATHPEQLPYGTQYGSPADLASANGAQGSGGALNPLNNVQSIAQQVISGQLSPSQAYAMGGSIGNWQGVLNSAIQQAKPGFNTASAQGNYEANQANTTTSGTTKTNAASSVYQKAYQDVQDLKTTTQNVDSFGNLLIQSMVDKDGNRINPNDTKFLNKTLSNIKNELSSEQQSVFDSTYASLKSRISGLLATGGAEIPTQITADANKVLDGSLPIKSLNAVLQRISTEGKILLGSSQDKLNSSGGDIGIKKVAPSTTDVTALRAKYGY